MAKRTVQFNMDFDINGLNTIGQLEDELEAINEQLKYVDVNSDAFAELSSQAREADAKLRTVNSQLEGITSTQKAEGLVKLADGLVGAFQLGAGASLIFGEKTSEQLEKVIAKVGGLFAAMDGIKKVTEAVSAENLKFVKGAVDGFKKSAISAKLFGTTARAAITSTGIGALIVGIGLLIANFDKVSAWFNKNFGPIVAGFQKLKDIVIGIGGAIKAAFTGGDIKQGYQDAIDTHERLNELQREYTEEVENTQDEHDRTLELLKLQEGKEQDIIDLEKERAQKIVDILTRKQEVKELTDEEVKALEDAEFQLQKLEIQQDKLNKKVAQAAEQTRKQAEEEKKRAEEAKKAAAEKAAADAKALADAKARLDALNKQIQGQLENKILEEDINEILNGRGGLIDNISKDQERITQINKEALKNNGELIFLEQERLRVSQERGLSEQERAARLEKINQAESVYLQEVGDKIKNSISLLNEEEQTQLKLIRVENARLQLKNQQIARQIEDLKSQEEATLWEEARAKNQEEINAAQEKRKGIQSQIISLETESIGIEGEIEETIARENQLLAQATVNRQGFVEIEKTTLETFKETFNAYAEEIYAAQELLNATFEIINNQKQAEFEQRIANLDYELELQKQALDDETKYRLEKIEEIDEAQEELADKEEELNDLLRDAEGERYNDILESLQAVRQEEAANAAAKAAEEKKQAMAQYQYDLAVWKRDKEYAKGKDDQAKAEKTQAIIMATIQTALAVVEALPSIPLSIIAGVLGAAGIAVIASQSVPKTPVPPAPKPPEGMAEGGYTPKGGKYEVAGVVHKGEWIAPQTLVNDPVAGQMIATLEGMRTKKFADGGFTNATTTTVAVQDAEDSFDYERLTNSIIQGLKANPQFVSVVEFRDVENRLQVVEDRSSI